MNRDQFESAIIEYVRALSSTHTEYTPSFFWERHVKEFNAVLNNKNSNNITLEEIWNLAKHFPQELPVRFGQAAFRQQFFLLKCIYWLHRNGIYTFSKERIENIAAVFFLKKYKLFDQYEALRRNIGASSTMTLARHFYYTELFLRHIKNVFGEVHPLRILEIGGGGGMLARMLYERGLIATYYDVDLPEILLSASLTLCDSIPDATFRFCGETEEKHEEAMFNFYPAQYFAKIPRASFDLIINVASFQEMDNAVRDRYIGSVKDLARRPTLFINVNRKQDLSQRNGTTIVNNPLQYPYGQDEEVLEWGADQMQDTIRANICNSLYCITPKSFPIVRVSLIK